MADAGNVFLLLKPGRESCSSTPQPAPLRGGDAAPSPACPGSMGSSVSQHSCSLSDPSVLQGCSMGRFVPRNGSDNAGECTGCQMLRGGAGAVCWHCHKGALVARREQSHGEGRWVLQALHSPCRNWVCLAPALVPKGSGRFCCLQGKRK